MSKARVAETGRAIPRHRWLWPLLLLSPLLATSVAAAPVVDKKVGFVRRGGRVTMSVGFRELFDAKLKRRLKSGFATTVVMRVYVYEFGSGRPIFATARTLRAVYDLWDEVFRVKIEDSEGQKLLKLRETKDVVDKLTSFWRFPLLRYHKLKLGKRYFAAALIEVNPMSREVLAAVRRWLRKSKRRQVGGDNLFGSFVSIFVNDKIRRAERTLKLRSQPFFRPE